MAGRRGLASWMHQQESQWRALAARHVLLRRAPAGRRMLDAIMFTMPSEEDQSPLAWQPSVIDEAEPIARAPTRHVESVRAAPRRPVALADTRQPERAPARSGPTTPQEPEVDRGLGKPLAPVGPAADAGIRFAHDPVIVPPTSAPSVKDTPPRVGATPASPFGPRANDAAPIPVTKPAPRGANDTAPVGATPASPLTRAANDTVPVAATPAAPTSPRVNDAAPITATQPTPRTESDAAPVLPTPASPASPRATDAAPVTVTQPTPRTESDAAPVLATPASPVTPRAADDTAPVAATPASPEIPYAANDAAPVGATPASPVTRMPPAVAAPAATVRPTPAPTADAGAGDNTAPSTVDARAASVSAVDPSRAALAPATPPAPNASRSPSPPPAVLNATETVAGAPSAPPREPSVENHGNAQSSAEFVASPPLAPPLAPPPPPSVPHPLGRQSVPIAEERRARREIAPRARPDVMEAPRQDRTDRAGDTQAASPAPSQVRDDELFAQPGRSPGDWLARLRATVAHERARTAGPSPASTPAHTTPATPECIPSRSARSIIRRAAAGAVRGPARTGSTTARRSHGEIGQAPRGDPGIARSRASRARRNPRHRSFPPCREHSAICPTPRGYRSRSGARASRGGRRPRHGRPSGRRRHSGTGDLAGHWSSRYA